MSTTAVELREAKPGFLSIPSRVKGIILALSFNELATGYFAVLVTAYLPEAGFSPGSIGLIAGVFGIVPVLTAFPLGHLSDRRGRKGILIVGSTGISLTLLVFALTSNLTFLLLGAVLFGLSEAATLATWNAIIADQTTPENRDHAFSLSFIVSLASMGVGSAVPILFPLMQETLAIDTQVLHSGFALGFSVLALLTPLALWSLLRNFKEVPSAGKPASKKSGNFGVLFKFSGINSLLGIGSGFIIPLILTWFYLRFGIRDTYSGPVYTLALITIALAAVAGPRIARRLGQVNSIVITEGLSMVFLLSIVVASSPFLAAGAFAVRSVLMNMASPLEDSYLMGIVESDERGAASALNSIIWRLPNNASTILGGFMLQSGYLVLPFFLAAGFGTLSILLFYANFKNVKAVG